MADLPHRGACGKASCTGWGWGWRGRSPRASRTGLQPSQDREAGLSGVGGQAWGENQGPRTAGVLSGEADHRGSGRGDRSALWVVSCPRPTHKEGRQAQYPTWLSCEQSL